MTATLFEGAVLLDESITAEGWRARVRVDPSCPLFDGHFEGEPVLPGVAQLAVVSHGMGAWAGGRVALGGLPSVRFRQRVRPGDTLDVFVGAPEADGRARFEVRVAGELAAHGVAEARRVG